MTTLGGFVRAGRFVLLCGASAAACSKDEAPSGGGSGGSRAAASGGVGGSSGGALASGTGGSSGGVGGANGGTGGSNGGTGGSNAGTSGASTAMGGHATGGNAGTVAAPGGAGGAGGAGANAGGSGAIGAHAGVSGAGAAPRGGAGGGVNTGGSAGAQAGAASTTAGAGGSVGGIGNGTLKIMAIGDSTTQATCWRAVLWQTLNTKHAGHFDFVGSHKSDTGCSPSNYDQDNEAYGSSLLSEAVSGTFANNRMCSPAAASGPCPKLGDFTAAFNTYKPDVALIHYGTNDVWNSVATNTVMTGFDELVDGLRAANGNVKVFVAKIIPMNVTNTTCSGCTCSACTSNIAALNSAIASWAPTKSTAASPLAVVDQNTGFDAVADTRDGVHPNDSGSQKMAAKWDAVLEPLF